MGKALSGHNNSDCLCRERTDKCPLVRTYNKTRGAKALGKGVEEF